MGRAMPSMSIAEELAKKQREISIAEFFERNKQILGYDSPTKALLTAVKEAVDNSVEHDEPVLLRGNGLVRPVRVGDYVIVPHREILAPSAVCEIDLRPWLMSLDRERTRRLMVHGLAGRLEG